MPPFSYLATLNHFELPLDLYTGILIGCQLCDNTLSSGGWANLRSSPYLPLPTRRLQFAGLMTLRLRLTIMLTFILSLSANARSVGSVTCFPSLLLALSCLVLQILPLLPCFLPYLAYGWEASSSQLQTSWDYW